MWDEGGEWVDIERQGLDVNFIVVWSLWARLPRSTICTLGAAGRSSSNSGINFCRLSLD